MYRTAPLLKVTARGVPRWSVRCIFMLPPGWLIRESTCPPKLVPSAPPFWRGEG
jgi:hypothetical protein